MFSHSTNTGWFFSVLMACAHFIALSGGGCLGAGQHQFWNRNASEQHHGHLQYGHWIQCTLWQHHGQLQHGQRIRCAL
jgi:hypothetical protein